MKKWYRILGIIFIAAICFLGAACEEEPPFEGASYISSKAPQTPAEFNDITASEIVAAMTIGWNLGNTMDAHGGETAWGNPVTKESNFLALKEKGFNTIRIPVSWSNATSGNGTIRASWMDRVTEIVNYAINNDMFVILNSHHDESIFKFTNSEKERSLKIFKAVWEQIAFNFQNYNEKLIFEGLNEPRNTANPDQWRGGSAEERANLNEHYQVFVDIVRASGGNNDRRILSINPYAASAFNPAVSDLVLPSDPAPDKLIVQIHCYNPYNFALNTNKDYNTWSKSNSNDVSSVTSVFTAAYNKFGSKGIPVIVGEFGAMNKNNDDAREEWAEFYVSEAGKKGMPCIVWDNGAFEGSGELFALLNRNTNTFPNPKYLEGLLRGAGVIK